MRKTVNLVITDEGRDKGKTFVLTEMSAMQAEKWAARAFMALMRARPDVPEDIASQGLAGIAALGIRALGNLSFIDAEGLLDEMLGCVRIQPGNNSAVVRALIPEDIEEVATLLKLRSEVFTLHTGFSIPDALSRSTLGMTSGTSSTIPTSPVL